MPTYDYECAECDHTFELFQSMSAKPIRKCPECGRLKVKRLIGAGSTIIFKGSGFYQTDYRSDEYKSRQKEEKTASSSEGKDKKTDNKTKKKKDVKD